MSNKKLIKVKLSEIAVDSSIQPRVQQCERTVNEYAMRMREGDNFPPIDLFECDECLLLAAGFHRVAGAKRAGLEELPANVHTGGRRAALLFALQDNAKHGLRPRPEDNRRAVELLLADSEWATWSTNAIASKLGLSWSFVATVRKQVKPDRETVTYERKGKTTTMKTSGFKPQADEPEQLPTAGSEDEPARPAPRRVQQNDKIGQPVPPKLRDVFGDEQMMATANSIESMVKQLKSSARWNRWLRIEDAVTAANRLQQVLRDAAPFAVCKNCQGSGCDQCRASGWVPEWRLFELREQMSANLRQQVA